jgi:hypothetical protein
MKRMIAAAVAVLGLAAMASAQTPHGPIQGIATGGCGAGGCGAAHAPAGFGMAGVGGGCRDCDPKFGVNPFFKKLMFWKKDNACGSCGRLLGGLCKGKNCAGVNTGGQFNPYPDGVPGTLVFPYNPHIRSPRDWYEK